MARICNILLGVLIIQLSVSAAPSDVEKIEDIAKVDKAEETKLDKKPFTLVDDVEGKHEQSDLEKVEDIAKVHKAEETKLDEKPLTLVDEVEGKHEQSQRQKRWYNPFGYPSFNPVFFQSFGKRDEHINTGYEYEDPLFEIHRRLQDITNVVRQPPPPPHPPQLPSLSSSQFPFYLPVIYVPQIGCSCPPQAENPTTNPSPGQENSTQPTDKNNTTMPDGVPNRFSGLDDPRQNFGLVVSGTDPDDEGDDVGRPISFDPILPDTPMSRPPPPVEHGSSQGSANDGGGQTAPPGPQAPTTFRPNVNPGNPTTAYPFSPAPSPAPLPEAPSACDGAVLSCCHQFEVTYDCFAVQGCPDPTSYGNPCDPSVILRVISRFQRFYGQRTG